MSHSLVIYPKPYESYGLDVFDSYYGYRCKTNDLCSTSLYTGNRLKMFLEGLDVTSVVSKSDVFEISSPALFLEELKPIPCFDLINGVFLTVPFRSVLIPDIKTGVLVVEMNANKNFNKSIAVFYPDTSMAMKRCEVSHYSDFLAYLDKIGIPREECKFTFVSPNIKENYFSDIIFYDQILLKRGENNSVSDSEIGLVFNSFEALSECMEVSNAQRGPWLEEVELSLLKDYTPYHESISVLIDFVDE